MNEPEEGILSDSEDPELNADQDKDLDPEKTVGEVQSYWETIKTVSTYMDWNYIPDLWTGNQAQPVGKISVNMPPEDWFTGKLESLDLIVCAGYQV